MRANLCPVCRQPVTRTMGLNIQSHFDSLRLGTCPGSGQPYRITLMWGPVRGAEPELCEVTA